MLVTSEGVNQGGVKERGRSQVGAVDEVAVPEGGMEEMFGVVLVNRCSLLPSKNSFAYLLA